MFGKNSNTLVNKFLTPLSSKSTTPTPSTLNNSINNTSDFLTNDPDMVGRSGKSINLCMSKRVSINDLTYLPKMSRKVDSFSLDDYPILIIASQLTLIEWV